MLCLFLPRIDLAEYYWDISIYNDAFRVLIKKISGMIADE